MLLIYMEFLMWLDFESVTGPFSLKSCWREVRLRTTIWVLCGSIVIHVYFSMFISTRNENIWVSIAIRLIDGRSSKRGEAFSFYSTASKFALGPTQPPIQWVSGVLFSGLKLPEMKLTAHFYLVLFRLYNFHYSHSCDLRLQVLSLHITYIRLHHGQIHCKVHVYINTGCIFHWK